MKRVKRHKIKKEKAESSFQQREQEEHDLAYYIHDRVELMHQVFSMIKYKELKAMAPECVRNLAIGDLQELCTEELLGISSKRLLAILDGAEPPSDTESSSPSPPPDQLETISLDSISSDEELLASSSKKKKHKHHHCSSKSKSKNKDKAKEPETHVEENSELSKASRAGLTVLELLELQARARAIRAQLQQEQANRLPSETLVESSHHSSDNEIEIKEETPDVVEISSEDEKPDVNQLTKIIDEKTTSPKVPTTETVEESGTQQNSQTITKHIHDLVIIVPHAKPTRKIKLNRNNVNISVPNNSSSTPNETRNVVIVKSDVTEKNDENSKIAPEKPNESKSKKKKRDKRKKTVEKDGSDHDEITLQLSDSEKMDLLDDLDESRKNYDNVSSSSKDTESSSSDSDGENQNQTIESSSLKNIEEKEQNTSKDNAIEATRLFIENKSPKESTFVEKDKSQNNCSQIINESNSNICEEITVVSKQHNCEDLSHKTNDNVNKEKKTYENRNHSVDQIKEHSENYNNIQNHDNVLTNETTITSTDQSASTSENFCLVTNITDTLSTTAAVDHILDEELNTFNKDASSSKSLLNKENVIEISSTKEASLLSNIATNKADQALQNNSDKDDELTIESKKDLSDGELSERQSSEVEAIDVQPEIFCISDEDGSKNKADKKKKKKEKKSKKEKKPKKSKSDFREAADQNFYRETNLDGDDENKKIKETTINDDELIDLDSDDVYEIFELSDDSSCYEVEGTVLSKEPTADEIEALSAKIDEIEREEVVTDKQIFEHEQMMTEKEISEQNKNIDNISWKDRYLSSSKVKKVLTTSNILNALRKKNKELKKKIEDSKKTDDKEISNAEIFHVELNIQLEEGSIEQYKTLHGSNKYVDPVKEPVEENQDAKNKKNKEECEKLATKASDENTVTKEMKKDAKQLLKMYKRLLKHNVMNKQKDSNKKKKKKQKKKEKLDNCSEMAVTKN